MKYLITLFFIVFTLAGCGGGGGGGGAPASNDPAPSPTPTPPTIDALTITGTSAYTDPDPAPINANVSSGKFTTTWQTGADTGGRMRSFLSVDDTFTEATDIEFYSTLCGDIFDCNAMGDGAQDCFFTTTNHIRCGSDPTGIDITAFLTGLPMQAYIIFEACKDSWLPAECATQSVLVELR